MVKILLEQSGTELTLMGASLLKDFCEEQQRSVMLAHIAVLN